MQLNDANRVRPHPSADITPPLASLWLRGLLPDPRPSCSDGNAADGRWLRDESGMGLLISLLILLVVSAIGSGLLVSVGSDLQISANEASRAQAFWLAESGLEQTRVDLIEDATWVKSVVDASGPDPQIVDPFPDTVTINGHTVTLATEGGDVVPDYYPLASGESLSPGNRDREIFLPPTSVSRANATGSRIWVDMPTRATGNAGVATPSNQRVRATSRVTVLRGSAWDNAIFAGSGQTGTMINGNVQVRGSIHVIGDEAGGSVLDWGGGSGVHNNYDGIGDGDNFGTDASKIPDLPTREYNGEMVQTLDAEVRSRYADLELSGGASLGSSDVNGDSDKETVDGFWTDGSVTTSGSSAIHADEQGGYDFGDHAQFPTLDDPWTDDDGNVWSSHRDYLNSRGLTIPVNEISGHTSAFSYSDANGNSISWDPTTKLLEVEGIVRVEGDLQLGRQGPVDRIEYRGEGTMYATQDVDIRWEVVPEGNYIDGVLSGDDGPIPAGNLGLIADRNVEIATAGGSTQLKIMAAIYGEESINVAKQTRIAGALVGNYFDMGTNVPRIFHVPDLATNIPPGMPGSDQLLVPGRTTLVSWYHERE